MAPAFTPQPPRPLTRLPPFQYLLLSLFAFLSSSLISAEAKIFFGKISPPSKVHRMKFLRCCNTDLWGDDRAIRASSNKKANVTLWQKS